MTAFNGIIITFLTFAFFFFLYYFISSKKKLVIKSLLVFLFSSSLVTSVSIFYYVSTNNLVLDIPFLSKQLVYSEEYSKENPKYENFLVVMNNQIVESFIEYKDGVEYAESQPEDVAIHYRTKGNIIWQSTTRLSKKVLLDVPLVNQYPELPRGCEVTSLAMVLQYYHLNADKLTLAEEVKKETTPLEVKDGKIYYGDPNKGFVGDMYDLNKPGYGVYHKPIERLAKQYKGDKVVDITGANFDHVLVQVSKGRPVWIITNTRYKKLPNSSFETWHTPNGKIDITYHLHSVVITGFDNDYIYFNDPLHETPNRKKAKQPFIEAWEQMGKQAIFILE
ncbi:C39 family peptidase [Evansella sp. AB-rgal1]|uniref:C39 family peptidase n=1 Tax=Evansella sp. AB-rgal1 TaxID=3242696 RepID=UPI00359CFEA8